MDLRLTVRDVVISPKESLWVALDSGGGTNETPDTGRFFTCIRNVGTIIGKFSTWEHYLFRGHPRGPVFNGIAVGSGDGRSWLARDDTRARGGAVAVWRAPRRAARPATARCS